MLSPEDQFTEKAQEWVQQIEGIIQTRRKKNLLRIQEVESQLASGFRLNGKKLNEKGMVRFKAQIQKLQAKNLELANAQMEINILRGSNQVYHLVKGRFDVPGKIIYDFKTNRVDICLREDADLNIFVHELKHAYQFEVGQLDVCEEGGGIFYDQQDEKEAMARNILIGPSVFGFLGMTASQRTLPRGPLNIPPHFGQEDMDRLYKKYKLRHPVAYRIKGETYFHNVASPD